MTRESLKELRERLLRDENVQLRIHERAYEIYRLRGGEPGHQAEDWFQAESEILKILIDEESRDRGDGDGPKAFEPRTTPEIAERAADTPAQTALERAESHSALSVWSSVEPPSASLAPEIGEARETGSESSKKKARAAKPAAPRKRKSSEDQQDNPKKAAGSKSPKKSKKE